MVESKTTKKKAVEQTVEKRAHFLPDHNRTVMAESVEEATRIVLEEKN